MAHCPVCTEKVLLPSGNEDSEVLFISSYPDEDEIKFGRQFAGQFWQLFRREVMKICNVDVLEWRKCFFLFHQLSKEDDCLNVSIDIMRKEMEGKRLIVVCGADATRSISGYSISDVNGLSIALNEVSTAFFIVTPTSIFSKGVGELRFALNNLEKIL